MKLMKWEIKDLEIRTSGTSVGRENFKIWKSTIKNLDFILVVGLQAGVYMRASISCHLIPLKHTF